MAPSNQENTYEIRSYRAEDQKEILHLFEAGMMSNCPEEQACKQMLHGYIQRSKESDLATIDTTYFKPGGHFWVATSSNGQVMGMIGLEYKSRDLCELRRLSVHENARGAGLGKQLVAHVEQWAISQGFKKITLTTGNVMVIARKMYESLAYIPSETKRSITCLQLLDMSHCQTWHTLTKAIHSFWSCTFSMGSTASKENEPAALAFIQKTISERNVTIFSKSYCPYCDMAKGVFQKLGVPYQAIELNQINGEPSGADIQAALATMTGRNTVPNVFLQKESIGGGTDVQALYESGQLMKWLKEKGVLQ